MQQQHITCVCHSNTISGTFAMLMQCIVYKLALKNHPFRQHKRRETVLKNHCVDKKWNAWRQFFYKWVCCDSDQESKSMHLGQAQKRSDTPCLMEGVDEGCGCWHCTLIGLKSGLSIHYLSDIHSFTPTVVTEPFSQWYFTHQIICMQHISATHLFRVPVIGNLQVRLSTLSLL